MPMDELMDLEVGDTNMQNGTKEQFTTGAQRDTHAGKCRPDLISPYASERVGEVNRKGAEHYGDRNWEKGMPFSRVMASLERHLMAFKQGRTDEDHLAQMVWNGQALLHYEAMIKRGLMDPALNDLPSYEQLPRIYNLKELHDQRNGTPTRPSFPQDSAWQPKGGNPEAHQYVPLEDIHAGDPDGGEPVLSDEQQWMVEVLADLGCKRGVAVTIAAGTTFALEDGPVPSRFAYIAGPMRGYKNFNFPAFDSARRTWCQYWNVISPADIDRAAGDENGDDQCKFALRDFYALLFMRSLGADNAVVFLEGWEKSTGARAEFAIASWLGLRLLNPSGKKLVAFHELDLLDSVLTGLRK